MAYKLNLIGSVSCICIVAIVAKIALSGCCLKTANESLFYFCNGIELLFDSESMFSRVIGFELEVNIYLSATYQDFQLQLFVIVLTAG